ncbi:MAG: guanylate kinase [Lachnospiraceae bacterium]|nr:guanylate kinase [Lachnospiraceae bacterium]
MSDRGLLTVISGFSGCGKGTVVGKLVDSYGYSLSISATTRNPRDGDVEGVHYFFITKEEFKDRIEKNGFLEWAEYVGNYYGTPKDYVETMLAQGKNVILEIEMQGGLKVKEQCPEAVLVFMVPPSAKELKSRLVNRGTEDMDTINRRIARASEEIDYINDYDYIVVNDDIGRCAGEIHNIITCEGKKVINNGELTERIKQDFKNI